jgi:nitrite reductase/ring-hydroxylating ferredoxin subunit
MRYVVGSLVEFPPGSRRIVRVGGREIGVFRVGDELYAIRNRCPHQGAPLCTGRIAHRVVSSAAGRVERVPGNLLVCPWHGWRYDMSTGGAYAPADPGVRTYEVSLEPADGAPAAVETFDVGVEGGQVVLHL